MAKTDGQTIAYTFINKRISTFLKTIAFHILDISWFHSQNVYAKCFVHTYIRTWNATYILQGYTHTHTHTDTHTRTTTRMYTRTHARTHAHERARKHTHTHTHTLSLSLHTSYYTKVYIYMRAYYAFITHAPIRVYKYTYSVPCVSSSYVVHMQICIN